MKAPTLNSRHGRRSARGVAVSAVAAGVSAALPWRCRGLRRIPRKGALGGGFVRPHCGVTGEPFRISTRPDAFRSLLGIASDAKAPTYAQLYSGDWNYPTSSGCMR